MNRLESFSLTRPLFFLDEGGGGGGVTSQPSTDADKALSDFEKWLESQPEDARKLYEAQLGKLRDTVSKLREADKAHAKDAELLNKLQEEKAKREKDAMSELDKAKAEAADALKAKEDAERKAQETLADLQKERLSNSITLIASELKFADPKDAEKLSDFDPKTYVVEGKPDEKAIRKTLEELAKAKPYLLFADDKQKGHGTPPPKKNGDGANKRQNDGDGDNRAPLVRL